MHIQDITGGSDKLGYLMRYRGQIIADDTAAAYDQLAASLRPLEITPFFRKEKGQHVILLSSGVVRPQPSKTWVNAVLFILTVFSVFLAGLFFTLNTTYEGPPNPTLTMLFAHAGGALGGAAAFTVSLLAILLAHECMAATRYQRGAGLSSWILLPDPLETRLMSHNTMQWIRAKFQMQKKDEAVMLDSDDR